MFFLPPIKEAICHCKECGKTLKIPFSYSLYWSESGFPFIPFPITSDNMIHIEKICAMCASKKYPSHVFKNAEIMDQISEKHKLMLALQKTYSEKIYRIALRIAKRELKNYSLRDEDMPIIEALTATWKSTPKHHRLVRRNISGLLPLIEKQILNAIDCEEIQATRSEYETLAIERRNACLAEIPADWKEGTIILRPCPTDGEKSNEKLFYSEKVLSKEELEFKSPELDMQRIFSDVLKKSRYEQVLCDTFVKEMEQRLGK